MLFAPLDMGFVRPGWRARNQEAGLFDAWRGLMCVLVAFGFCSAGGGVQNLCGEFRLPFALCSTASTMGGCGWWVGTLTWKPHMGSRGEGKVRGSSPQGQSEGLALMYERDTPHACSFSLLQTTNRLALLRQHPKDMMSSRDRKQPSLRKNNQELFKLPAAFYRRHRHEPLVQPTLRAPNATV